jgi:hypothetical protein
VLLWLSCHTCTPPAILAPHDIILTIRTRCFTALCRRM